MPTAASAAARRRSTITRRFLCCFSFLPPPPPPPSSSSSSPAFHAPRRQQQRRRLIASAATTRQGGAAMFANRVSTLPPFCSTGGAIRGGVAEVAQVRSSTFAAARLAQGFILRSRSCCCNSSFFYNGNRAAAIRLCSSAAFLMEEGPKRQRFFSSGGGDNKSRRTHFPTSFGDSRRTKSPTTTTTSFSNQQRSRRNVHFEINEHILELGRQQQWQSLLEYVHEQSHAMNNVNLATFWTQLARSRGGAAMVQEDARFRQQLRAVADTCEQRGLPWMGARETANILHALGRLLPAASHSRQHDDTHHQNNNNNSSSNPRSVQRILAWVTGPETAVSLMQQAGRPQEIGNVAWSLARLECSATMAHNFLASADDRAWWIVERGTLQDISNLAWASAKLGYPAQRLFGAINHADFAQRLVREGKPQDMANIVWACAKLGHPTVEIFEMMERHAIQLFVNNNNHKSRWNPQDLSNTLWAFATLGHRAPKLFAAIDECHAEFLVARGKPQEVSNAAWAYATLQAVPAPRLFRAIGGGLDDDDDANTPRQLVLQGTPQTIANTSWAFAATSSYGQEAARLWFAAVQEHRSHWLREGTAARHGASIAWSFATLQWDAPDLFRDVDRHAGACWDAPPGAQELSNTLHALATLGFAAPHLCAAMEEASKTESSPSSSFLDGLLTQGSAQEVCNATWAYSILAPLRDGGVVEASCLCKLWDRALELFLQNESRFANEALYQLAQTQLFARAEGIELQEVPERMSERMVQALDTLNENIQSSGTGEISKLLEDLGVEHEFEVAPNDNSTIISTRGKLFAVDLACPRLNVVIEFDGPSHFLKALESGRQQQRTATERGSTQAKRRLCQKFGWTVVNIDYREFNKAKQSPDLKEWLRARLHAAGVALSAE